jgi:hypothetical protein
METKKQENPFFRVKMRQYRRIIYGVLMLAGLLVAAVALTGCASTRVKRLSGQEFINQARQMSELNSFQWTNYLGCTASRAYLEFGHPAYLGNGSQITVYWCDLSELPDDVTVRLRKNDPPWKPLPTKAIQAFDTTK